VNTLLISTNILIILVISITVLSIFIYIKSSIKNKNKDLFTQVYFVMLFFTLFGSILSLYIAIVEIFLSHTLFANLAINLFFKESDILVFSFSAFFALMFLLMTYFQLVEYAKDALKRLQTIAIINEKLDALYEAMDNMAYKYFKAIQSPKDSKKIEKYFTRLKDDVTCMECMVNIYYALIFNINSLKIVEEKIKSLISVLKSNDVSILKNSNTTNIEYFKSTEAISQRILDKLQEILLLIKPHDDIFVKKVDKKFVIDIKNNVANKDEKLANIMEAFEALSIIITDNKYLYDELRAILNEYKYAIQKNTMN